MISVVITCYNDERFIENAIQSVLYQTSIDYIDKIVLVDDSSTDNSKYILLRYSKICDKIDIVFHKENRGISAARNSGIRLCESDYIAFLDADDFWAPDKIEKQIEKVRSYPEVGIFFSNFIAIHGDRKTFHDVNKFSYFPVNITEQFLRYFLIEIPILPSSALVKRVCFMNCAFFDEFFESAEDTEMWFRIASRYPIMSMPDYLVFKREKLGSLGSDTKKRLYYTKKAIELTIKRNPVLKKLRNKKLTRVYYGAGFNLINIHKDKVSSQKMFLYSLSHDPFFWKSYLYLCLSLLPFDIKRAHMEKLKRLKGLRSF